MKYIYLIIVIITTLVALILYSESLERRESIYNKEVQYIRMQKSIADMSEDAKIQALQECTEAFTQADLRGAPVKTTQDAINLKKFLVGTCMEKKGFQY